MCGICGFYGFENKSLLKEMCEVMHHRGPDSTSYFIEKKVSLGSTRLGIIDLKNGRQPIFNEDKSICIVFNGEIYNFIELREELEAKGHRFSTNSDTETIVHAYEEYGINCLSHFIGMFTFAIWDSHKRQLFLARDRVGIKPLYYTIIGNCLFFASEIKALLKYEDFKRTVNSNAINLYLSFRYIPGSQTLFEGVHKFPPGHYLILNSTSLSMKKYWDIPNNTTDFPEAYYSGNILQLLSQSVNQELVSDVPIGVYASGGLDSSSILSLINNTSKIKTFTVGFEDESKANELQQAQGVSEAFGTDHYETIVNSSSFSQLPKIVWHLDNLIGDPVIVPNYALSQLAKDHVKVILCGEGADEIFGGYVHHRNALYGNYYLRYIPSFMQKVGLTIIKRIPHPIIDTFFDYPASLGKEGKNRVIQILSALNNPAKSYEYQISLFTEKDKEGLFNISTDNHKTGLDFIEESFKRLNTSDVVKKISLHEFKTWLPDYILAKLDYLTMANSIEGRVPFLDHRLVEFGMNIPTRFKIKRMQEKYILRKALKGRLPLKILKRKKQAFIMPLSGDFKKEINEIAKSVFSEEQAKKRSFYNRNYLENLYNSDSFISGKQLFALLALELWHRIYIDEEKEYHLKKL